MFKFDTKIRLLILVIERAIQIENFLSLVIYNDFGKVEITDFKLNS